MSMIGDNYKDKIKSILKLLVVFGIFFFSYLFQYIPRIIFNIKGQLSGTMTIIISTFDNIMVLLCLFLIYRKELIKEWKIFKKNILENLNTGFNYWFIGLLIMVASNLAINIFFDGGVATNEQYVQKMISTLPWLMVINAGIIAPINEELIFRKAIKGVFKNKWVFMIISFLLFGGAHIIDTANSFVDWLYIIPYGSLGAVFALSYYDTNTVFTPISMHMFHNISLTILSILL